MIYPIKDGWLSEYRARGIIHTLYNKQGTFACHKTTHRPEHKQQHCAGAMILMERSGTANQMMRVMERIGMYDRDKLEMDSPVFDDPMQFIEWHKGKNVVTGYQHRQANGEPFTPESQLNDEQKQWLEKKNQEMMQFLDNLELEESEQEGYHGDYDDY